MILTKSILSLKLTKYINGFTNTLLKFKGISQYNISYTYQLQLQYQLQLHTIASED